MTILTHLILQIFFHRVQINTFSLCLSQIYKWKLLLNVHIDWYLVVNKHAMNVIINFVLKLTTFMLKHMQVYCVLKFGKL